MQKSDLKIALAFDANYVQDWMNLFSNGFDERHKGLNLIACSSLRELVQAQPSIVVGHESDFLLQYLREHPLNLKWVQFMSAGLDKTLELLGRKKQPFNITNMKGLHRAAMREYVFSCILYFEKELPLWISQQRERVWSRKPLNLLENKTIVILGTGAIGTAVAEAAQCFSMKPIGISRSGTHKPPFHRITTLPNLESELGEADYVIIAMPLTHETMGIFDQSKISLMKPGAVFINISRGELVDEPALLHALQFGHLRGAALDTFVEEPLKKNSPLWEIPNLLITPHVSGKFLGGQEKGVQIFLENFELFLAGKKLKSEVLPGRGY